jgi:hypothetical protein
LANGRNSQARLIGATLLIVGLLGGYYIALVIPPRATGATTTVTSVLGLTTAFTTTCSAPTSTSPYLGYGSCLAVSSASLDARGDRLRLDFSTYGAPALGVSSITLTGPTISGVCGFSWSALPNNATITGRQITLDVSGCPPIGGSVISANDSYVYTLVSDWGAGTVFTGVVVAQ